MSVCIYPRLFASLVKFEHTVFALPFAFVGAFLGLDAVPGAEEMIWLTLAMVGARSLAMALNRLIDTGVDARNPRTAGRELPRGALTRWQVVVFSAAALALFLVAVFQLDPVVRWLWPIPVAMFVVYPYLKRATWLCHVWLGATLGLAPVGGWVAITGELPWQCWLVGAAVAAWVAGFDVFYSLFDLEIDRGQGLHSFPARFGAAAGFWAVRVLHAGTIAFLAAAGLGLPVGLWYWLGIAAIAALLAYEHSLVAPGDLRRLNAAFFTMNGVISVVFFLFVLADVV